MENNPNQILSQVDENSTENSALEQVKKELVEAVGRNAGMFERVRDQWEETGKFSKEEMNKFPEVIRAIKDKLLEGMKSHKKGSYLARFAQRWIDDAQIMSREEMMNIPEVAEYIKNALVDNETPPYFYSERSTIVDSKLMSLDEINKLPEIVKMVEDRIARKAKEITVKSAVYRLENSIRDWAELGILTKEDILKNKGIIGMLNLNLNDSLKDIGPKYYTEFKKEIEKIGFNL